MPCHDNVSYETIVQPDPKTERDLCEARWVIEQLLGKLGKVRLDQKLKTAIVSHRKAQRAHRREDRDFVIQKLADMIDDLDDAIADIKKLDGKPSTKMLRKRAELQNVAAQLKQLTDAELAREYWKSETCVAKILIDEKKG